MKYKGSEAINSSGCTQTMGFIGYYRSFVINFSCRASTINNLLQDKKDLFSLSEKQKKKKPHYPRQKVSSVRNTLTFKHHSILKVLIDILLHPPVMAYPNFNRPLSSSMHKNWAWELFSIRGRIMKITSNC